MRNTWWFVALFAGVAVLAGVNGSFGTSKPKPAKAPPRPVRVEENKSVVVDGYGEDEKSARANALLKAQEVIEERLRDSLRDQFGDVNRPFPARLFAPSYLENMEVLSEVGKPEPDPNADRALRARYKVTVNDAYVAAAAKVARDEWVAEEKQERQDRVGDRHLFLARALGGILAVLLVVAGYFRLEEATRGYYTTLLRVGVVAVLVATAVGLWWSASF